MRNNQFEKVPIFLIFKQGTKWSTERGKDIDDWQLLGFLTALTEDLKHKMMEEFEPTDEEGML